MVTNQNLDLRNVIVHGNSSEQELVQTHCLGSPISLQVQSLQTSRESKCNISKCCKPLQTVSEDHHKTYYVCGCGHMHQCLHACLFSVALTMMKLHQVFYSDSTSDFDTQLWQILALTLFKPTALAWAADTSDVPGVNSSSTFRKKNTRNLKIVSTQNLTVSRYSM